MRAVMLSIVLLSLFRPITAIAAADYLGGNISNITSLPNGLLIMLDTGVPTNCQGTPYNWMLIKEANKTMVSVALSMWVAGNKAVTVYTGSIDPALGYCTVTQLDPVN